MCHDLDTLIKQSHALIETRFTLNLTMNAYNLKGDGVLAFKML